MPHATDNKSNDTTELDRLVAQFNRAQTAFLEFQEYMDYYWSLDNLTFEVDKPGIKLVYPLIPVGIWSVLTGQFTWGFGVSHFPECARTAAERLRGMGKTYGYPQYDSVQFDLPHVELDDLLSMAHDYLKTEVVFKEKSMEPWLFFALGPPETQNIPDLETQNE